MKSEWLHADAALASMDTWSGSRLYDAWKAAFHAIPDLNAELVGIDAWLFHHPGNQSPPYCVS